jgi:tRNA threonylcarbamoyl adenosine modification protein (Sua5/YciO/YrdC/YwlC family)
MAKVFQLGFVDGKEAMEACAGAINAGQLIVLPVNSGYVFACDFLNSQAAKDLYTTRKQEQLVVPTLIFPDLAAVHDVGHLPQLHPQTELAVESGSLMLIIPSYESFRPKENEQEEFLGVNIPSNDFIKKLLSMTVPCQVMAANPVGEGMPTNMKSILLDFEELVEVIIDIGDVELQPSTVINSTEEPPTIARIGALSVLEVFELIPQCQLE